MDKLEAAVVKGPHVSALAPDAIDQIQVETREKEKQGFATIYAPPAHPEGKLPAHPGRPKVEPGIGEPSRKAGS